MIKSFRAGLRRFFTALGREVVSPLVFRLSRRPKGAVMPISVHMLVSSSTWHAGVLAMISFEFFTGRKWDLYMHEDGTVSAADRSRIERLLPGVRFVPRREADQRSLEFLQNHPRCFEARGQHNLFLKFSDTPAFAPHDRFVVLDSDIIFFKRPTEILEWADSGREEVWFNQDTREVYCISRERLEDALRVPLWSKVNSGLCLFPAKAISLDLSERMLENFATTAWHPKFFEQTLYALNGSAWNRGGMLPLTYNISWGYLRAPGSICRHYVGDFKHDLLYVEGAPLLLLALLRSRLTGAT